MRWSLELSCLRGKGMWGDVITGDEVWNESKFVSHSNVSYTNDQSRKK